jgi:predicted alpha/beta hydrolase family esterase
MELGEKKIAEIEKASLEAAQELLAETPKLTGEFFLAREGEKETIIATIDFPALEKWRAKVKKVYPEVEFHFPHTTLYKNEAAGKGIPISSKEVFENLTEKLDDESEKILRKAFGKVKAILIHGNGGGTKDDHWQAWLAGELEKRGVEVINETFPDNDLARAKYWLPYIEKLGADENTILIGHSSGAVAAMRYAENHKILGSFLVAPCYTDLGDEDEKKSGYYDEAWDWEKIRQNQKFIVQFSSQNDPYIPIDEARFIHDNLNSDYTEKTDAGHFRGQEGFEKFPELLDKITERLSQAKNNAISLADLTNPLDKWIVNRAHELRNHITKYLDEYNLPDAMSAILPMIDDASNWYVRRSRRRFWKSEDDGDKNDAYRTLHYVLVYLSQILAPFVPFLAEELYQKLTGGESVHLLDWPEVSEIDERVLSEMSRTREIIEKGLALRMDREDKYGQIKVRQPLAKLTYGGEKLDDFYEQIIADEVNVKRVARATSQSSPQRRSSNPSSRVSSLTRSPSVTSRAGTTIDEVALDKSLTPELRREGAAREIIRLVQNARKNAGLNVDDRIVVNITTPDTELLKAIDEHRETIATEILATKFTENNGYHTTAKIDDAELKIQLKKTEQA